MGTKLDGNGRWESKFVLPEHHEAIVKQRREFSARLKPTLLSDEIERIERMIRLSCTEKHEITLHMYDRYEDLRVIGVVERIDSYDRRIRINGDWFRIGDVVGADDCVTPMPNGHVPN